jgi:XrtJ-associated TM-motif-TM protein
MKRSVLVSLGSILFLLIARPLYAQIGCTDSPENPTVILALVGSGGALYSTIRARRKTRHK